MTYFPPRTLTLALGLVAGVIFGPGFEGLTPAFLLPTAAAQTVATAPTDSVAQPAQPSAAVGASPAAADQKLASDLVNTDTKSRHLAPHDTFYLLSYVAARTDTGVEGFNPGQEVHLVEVHRPTRTLVVTDGHAQVEVPPSKLTNDMDIAALVRQKDEASQAQVAAYIQAEQAASAKYEREAADFTAKDLANRRQEQQTRAAEARAEEQKPVAQTAEPVNASVDGNGYYGYGGYGYGTPNSYFIDSSAGAAAPRNNLNTTTTAGSRSNAATGTGRAANPATVGTAGRPPR